MILTKRVLTQSEEVAADLNDIEIFIILGGLMRHILDWVTMLLVGSASPSAINLILVLRPDL